MNAQRLWLAMLMIFGAVDLCQPQQQASSFYLPQNPVAAAYVLGRLSNQELIDAPRGEFVYTALLERAGLDRKYRLEAIQGLAQIRHTDAVTQILRAMADLDKKAEESDAVLRELGALLCQSKASELLAQQPQLEEMSRHARLGTTRQFSWAARIIAAPRPEPDWGSAPTNQLADLLLAIPQIPSQQIRESFYPKIRQNLGAENSPFLIDAAATAAVSLAGHEREIFQDLAALVIRGLETPAIIDSLSQVPAKDWNQEQLPALAQSLTGLLAKVPTDQRTQADFTRALQFANELASHLPPAAKRGLTRILRGLGPTILTLHAVYEQMRFDRSRLIVEANRPVVIVLQNDDAMPHNLAILAPGALKEIGEASEKMSPVPDAEGRLYVPASPKVLHATKLVTPGQKMQLSFEAPAAPGEYPYVCTFPGHWLRMFGTLLVVADLDQYLSSHPNIEEPKVTEWKLADFLADLSDPGLARNAATGKEWFSKLACVQCHRIGGQGYAYGPDLTEVFKRYQNDRAAVLQQILEPSLRIEDRYRNINFQMKDGDSLLGLVLKQDAESVTIQSGPSDSLIQTVRKADIERQRAQTSSPMPLGLLNALSKQDVLDLLAYLESGGVVQSHSSGLHERHTH